MHRARESQFTRITLVINLWRTVTCFPQSLVLRSSPPHRLVIRCCQWQIINSIHFHVVMSCTKLLCSYTVVTFLSLSAPALRLRLTLYGLGCHTRSNAQRSGQRYKGEGKSHGSLSPEHIDFRGHCYLTSMLATYHMDRDPILGLSSLIEFLNPSQVRCCPLPCRAFSRKPPRHYPASQFVIQTPFV